jgi:hypothetical protein
MQKKLSFIPALSHFPYQQIVLHSIVLQGDTDLDLELDVDSHPTSPFADVNQEEVLIPLNIDRVKREEEVGCVFSIYKKGILH